MQFKDYMHLIEFDTSAYLARLKGQLERKEYVFIRDIFERFGGKWNKRANAFEFRANPLMLIEAYLKSDVLPDKNPTAFFPTPSVLGKELLFLSGLSEQYLDEDMHPLRILEPSGGVGGLADEIRALSPYLNLDVVEILEVNQNMLKAKGYEPICSDFMEYNKDYSIKYDYAIMNPPFSLKGDSKAYITHVLHAFNMLDDFGVLGAIIPTGFMTNSTKKEKEFLELVTQCGEIYKNQKSSFKESGTNVDTYSIVLHKHALKWRLEEYQSYVNFHVFNGVVSFMNDGNYMNKFIKYSEKPAFLKDGHKEAKKRYLEYVEDKNKEEILFSVEYADEVAKHLVKQAVEHREYLGLDKSEHETTEPVNNTLYSEADIAIFKTGSLF